MSLGGDFQQEVDLARALQGRRRRVPGRRAPIPRQAAHVVDRAVRIARARRHRDRDHRPLRRPGAGPTRRPRARTAPSTPARRAIATRSCGPPTKICAAPPTCSTRARRSRSSSARAPRHAADELHRGRRAAGRGRGQGAQRARRAARRPALRHRLDRPARDQAVRRHDGGLRHAAHGRHVASPTRSGCPSPARRAACRSTSTPAGSASATRWRWRWRATRRRRCAPCVPLLERKQDRAWRREIEESVERWWRLLEERATGRRPTRSTRSSSSTSSPRGCPTTRIVLADSGSATNWFARHLRLRARDGRRAAAGRWPRCARRCPTRWRPSSPSRAGRSSRAWATARCRCSASTP